MTCYAKRYDPEIDHSGEYDVIMASKPDGQFVLWKDYAALLKERNEFHKEMRGLQDALWESDAATQWQPIETAPKDGTWVLCKVEEDIYQYESIIVLRYVIGSWGRPGISGYRATHWMPLPKPPTE